jgi:hypothetical protein
MEMAASGALAAALTGGFRRDRVAAASESARTISDMDKPIVVRAYDPEATFWDYKTADYLDFIRPEIVDGMLGRGIMRLTAERSVEGAWRKLIPNYSVGERVAIKPNFNSLHLDADGLITCPQLIRAVVKGLVESLSVRESDIYVYDLCKWIPAGKIRDRVGFQINYVERRKDGFFDSRIATRLGWGLESADKSARVEMSSQIADSDGDAIECFMPKVLTNCEHLINIALLSNHPFLAISGPLKNHFGTVRFSNYSSYPGALHGAALEPSIVDLNMNPHIRDKTRLFVCDALLGQFARGEGGFAQKWKTFPSEDEVPNSLFFATDAVAMESMLLYFVNRERRERGLEIRSHEYLHLADRRGLGVHEDIKRLDEIEKISFAAA